MMYVHCVHNVTNTRRFSHIPTRKGLWTQQGIAENRFFLRVLDASLSLAQRWLEASRESVLANGVSYSKHSDLPKLIESKEAANLGLIARPYWVT